MPNEEPKGALGRFLEAQLAPGRPRAWRNAFLAILLVIAVVGVIVPNHHPHFGYDSYRLFWPVFGLGAGLVLIFVVKKIIQPLIKRPEDHYGDL
jgi:membrane protease YdiL (CAAX protease family)